LGILRTFLALCVFVEHGGGTIFGVRPLPGLLAVEAFYIISGFYMALVLSEKYHRPGGLPTFYMARARRLFPIYWVVLAATIVVGLLFIAAGLPTRLDAWLAGKRPDDALVVVGAVLSNLAMFGLDWFRLTMTNTQENAGALVIVVQAWTLGLELTFYLLAPFLVRLRTGWLVAIALASFLARAIVYSLGPVIHVWTNSFFPFELAFFLGGMIAYRAMALARTVPKWNAALYRWGPACLVVTVAFGFFGFAGSPPVEYGWGPLRNWILLLMIALALPALFIRFGSERVDDAVGQFSYPVYMLHFLVISVVTTVLPLDPGQSIYLSLVLTLAGCVWLIRVFEKPAHAPAAAPPDRRPRSLIEGGHLELRAGEHAYPVLVSANGSGFLVRIQELQLTAVGLTLQQAYDDLIQRKDELIAWARSIGTLDELPPPSRAPLVQAVQPSLAKRAADALCSVVGR
jgi:peptidoglycan/LPS O-acetylase OafA/YrhL